MSILCENCKQEIDSAAANKEIQLLSMDPMIAALVVTCEHCDHEQKISIMDSDQVEAFKRLKVIDRKIRIAQGHGFRDKAIRTLMKEQKELTIFLHERNKHLMEMYEISRMLEK